MKTARGFSMMDTSNDPIPLYPHTTPSNYSPTTVTSVCKVILSGVGTPRLEYFWRKSLQGVIAWRIAKASIQNPLFVGENEPFFFFETNLPFPSPNEGRLNGEVRQVAASIYKPSNVSTFNFITQNYQADQSSWFRPKNYIDIDNIYVQVCNKDGGAVSVGPAAFWSVELEFLFVVNHCQ